MNGEPLRPVHGYPLRLVVPGWYGMASVKWLRRLTLLAEPFEGFFQSRRYVYIPSGEAQARWEPVTSLKVKSLITMPRHGEVVRRGGYTVEGAAWSGEGPIARVELSIDGGRELAGGRALRPRGTGRLEAVEAPVGRGDLGPLRPHVQGNGLRGQHPAHQGSLELPRLRQQLRPLHRGRGARSGLTGQLPPLPLMGPRWVKAIRRRARSARRRR